MNVKAGRACKNQADSDVSPSAHSWRPRKSNASAALSDLTLHATSVHQFFHIAYKIIC